MSLSKSVQHRTEEEERRDRKKYRKRARDWKRKRQLLSSLFSDTEEDKNSTSFKTHEQRSSKSNTTSVERETSESRDSSKKTGTADSEVKGEDGPGVKVRENAKPSVKGGKGQTKMAEGPSSSEETEKMEEKTRTLKHTGKKNKRRGAIGESVGGWRDRKKVLRESEAGAHKHFKSSRKKRQTLLKLKLRKTVSKARLKSYSI